MARQITAEPSDMAWELLEELMALLTLFYSRRLFVRLSSAETFRAASPPEMADAQP